MWTEKNPTRSSHVPALPPIDSPTSQQQHHFSPPRKARHPPWSSSHWSDTPEPSSFKDRFHHSLPQLTGKGESDIVCDPSRFVQLEGRVARLEEANRAYLAELLEIQSVVRARQGSMKEETRQLRSSVDMQGADTEAALSSLRQQLKRLGEEQETTGQCLVKVVTAEKLDNAKLQFKKYMDSKVSELEAEVGEMKGLLAHLENERRRQEMWLKESFSKLQDQQLWLSHQTADSLQSVSMEMEAKEKKEATEHTQLVTRFSSALERERKESQEEQERVRELLQTQLSNFEKALNDECDARSCLTAEVTSKMAVLWEEVEGKVDKDIGQLKATVEQKHQSLERTQSTMHDSLALLETEGKVGRETLSTVLNAEITTRQKEMRDLQYQCSKLHKTFQRSESTLREMLGSLEETKEAGRNELHSLEQKLVSEWQEMGKRILADVSARVLALHQHITQSNTNLSSRKNTRDERETDQELREAVVHLRQDDRLEQLEHGQRVVRVEVESLHNRLQQNSDQLQRLTTTLQEMQLKLTRQLQQETSERFHAILDLRNEVANMQAQISLLFSPPHPHFAGYTPGNIRQPPAVPQGPKFPLAATSEQPQRMVTIADHGYLSGMPGQSIHEMSHYFEIPMTGAVPFEEGQRADESEGSLDLDLDSEESKEENQEHRADVTRKDQFETSPEPRSLHSSISESYLKRAKMPLTRVRALQRHRVRNTEGFYFPNLEGADHETQGTFTSAAPTPDSQQQVLLRPHITGMEEEANNGEEEANNGEEEEENDGEEVAIDGDKEANHGEEEHEEQGDFKSQELPGSCELHQRGDKEYSQHSVSRTETDQNSNGDTNEDIETDRGTGDISPLTTDHQATHTLSNSSSHDLAIDTEETERRRESGGFVADGGDQQATLLLSSLTNIAEQAEVKNSPSPPKSDEH